MAFAITIQGTIKDQGQNPVAGLTVEMQNELSSVLDSDITDASGFYTVTTSVAGHDTYQADPLGSSPHYSDPGLGPAHAWDGLSNQFFTEDFATTFSNANPTRSTVGNHTYTEDDGTKTVTKAMGDADAGDVLTPVKLSGPSWGTLSKVSSTQYRWSFNTATPAPGAYSFSYRIEDDFGGQSPTENFSITILTANQPPVWVNPGTVRFEANSGLRSFQLVAPDPEGQDVDFSKVAGQTWATVDLETGLVTVNTAGLVLASYPHTWRATDAAGGSANQGHSIEIIDELLFGPYNQVA